MHSSNRSCGRGSTLTLVLPCLFMLSMLGISLIGASLTGTRVTSHRRASAAAFELAEAGFNHAIRCLHEDEEWSGIGATSLGDGTFRVTVTTSSTDWNKRAVRSTGRIVLSSGAVLERTVRGMADFQPAVWDYAIITKQALTMTGEATVSSAPIAGVAHVHSNVSVTLGSSNVVNGNVSAVGTVNTSGTVSGRRLSNVPAVPFPTYDLVALRAEAEAKGTRTGDVSLSGGTTTLGGVLQGNLSTSGTASLNIDGILWVTGNVNLSGVAWTGGGALICEGTMYVAGGSGFTGLETPDLVLMCLSSANPAMTLTGSATIMGPLYCPNGTVSISGQPKIVGTLAANSVAIGGQPTFTRDTRFKSPWLLAAGPRVRFWQEGP